MKWLEGQFERDREEKRLKKRRKDKMGTKFLVCKILEMAILTDLWCWSTKITFSQSIIFFIILDYKNCQLNSRIISKRKKKVYLTWVRLESRYKCKENHNMQ